MREIGKEELKKIQIAILVSIHEFCEQQGLRYSLCFGTLLGAVRHKGFIPWDDDIDIMMPRPDYERFRTTYPGFNPHYSVQSYHIDDSYWFNFVKVYDNRTLFIEDAARNGVFVDVFPVDGFPDDNQEIEHILDKATLLLNRDLRWATKEYKVKTQRKDFIPHYLKYMCRNLLVDSRQHTIKKIDNLFLSNSFDSSSMAGVFFFDKMLAILPKSLYEQYKLIQFEGYLFYCIDDTHRYLKSLYGDYMQLPPLEQRVGRHNIHAFWL